VPQGIFERTVAVFIVLVVAGLIVLLVPSWQRYQDRVRDLEAGGAPATALTEVATTTALAEATTTAPLPPAPATTALAPPRPVRLARLAIAATRGDCWLAVRKGSASGQLLYTGFLSAGESRRFRAKRLWVRLGASGNVDLRLNGKRVPGVPSGTVVLLVGPKSIRTIGFA
jgi:hypothetical protein